MVMLPDGGFMWLYVAVCGCMWLYVDMERIMAGYGAREASGASRASACCLLPDSGCDGQKKPNFMFYNILLTIIVLIIVIDIILLRQIFVYVLEIYYLCSDFLTYNIKRYGKK